MSVVLWCRDFKLVRVKLLNKIQALLWSWFHLDSWGTPRVLQAATFSSRAAVIYDTKKTFCRSEAFLLTDVVCLDEEAARPGDAQRDWNEITATGKEGRSGPATAMHSSESGADDGKELGFHKVEKHPASKYWFCSVSFVKPYSQSPRIWGSFRNNKYLFVLAHRNWTEEEMIRDVNLLLSFFLKQSVMRAEQMISLFCFIHILIFGVSEVNGWHSH